MACQRQDNEKRNTWHMKLLYIFLVLISLLLFWFLYIEYNWYSETIEEKRTRFGKNVNLALIETGRWLMHSSKYDTTEHIATIDEEISAEQIHERLAKAFEMYNVDSCQFDFTILKKHEGDELQTILSSETFSEEAMMSERNLTRIFPVLPEEGSDAEGLTPYQELVVVIYDYKKSTSKQNLWFFISTILCVFIFTAFFITLMAFNRQKKLSQVKKDFLDLMADKFKTPITTISVAIDAMIASHERAEQSKTDFFANVIKDEVDKMSQQVEKMLHQAAERGR